MEQRTLAQGDRCVKKHKLRFVSGWCARQREKRGLHQSRKLRGFGVFKGVCGQMARIGGRHASMHPTREDCTRAFVTYLGAAHAVAWGAVALGGGRLCPTVAALTQSWLG